MKKFHGVFSLPALTLVFANAAAEPEYTYWKHADYDAVIRMWKCEAGGICADLYYLNEKDPKVREKAAKILKKRLKKLQDSDVLSFCGLKGEISLVRDLRKFDIVWDGTIWWPYNGGHSLGLEITEESEASLKVRGYFRAIPFIGKTVTLQNVPSPPPSCQKPA